MRSVELFIFLAATICIVTLVEGGQPTWSSMLEGNNIYTISTDTWQECGLLCTRNYQTIEQSLLGTTCTAWSWNDPSNRHYANICRFFEDEHTSTDNGQAISGVSGCYSLSTC